MGGKLHELLAVESDKEQTAKQITEETILGLCLAFYYYLYFKRDFSS
jgi:hypothetical protein|tara:strand:- start:421 stop:561 length:141 start_codon:yes stop_codon:yes gene_type:complete